MIPFCPECGTQGVPLMFGLPAPEAVDAAEDGHLALGGCVLRHPAPNWQCAQGHQWRDDDEEAWDRCLLAVLTAHGYRES